MPANRTAKGRWTRTGGFTLLEVVVALAIAALALVGLFHAGGDGIFAADTAAQTQEAIERAQSHLAAFGRVGALTPSELEGDDGSGYRWRLRATAIAGQPAVSQSTGLIGARQRIGDPLALYDIEVAISWRSGRRNRSVVLETRRLAAAPGPE